MARTNLPVTNLVANSALIGPASTAIDQPNGMNVKLASGAIPAASSADRLVLYVQNTTASTQTVTVRAGVGGGATPGSAFRSGLGDFVSAALPATTGVAFIGPLDPSRFVQLDGSINVDFSAVMTGTITAFLLPRSF